MREYEEFFLEYAKEHPSEALAAAESVENYIKNSTAGGREGDEIYRVHPALIPKIFSHEDFKILSSLSHRLHMLCNHVITLYRSSPEVRRLFAFPAQLEELILADPIHTSLIPMARYDLFYNEDTKDFKFCEINTDGTSAMNENRELYNSLDHNPIYQSYLKSLPADKKPPISFELFRRWVITFQDIYDNFLSKIGISKSDHPEFPEKPNVAIIDFLDKAYMEDLTEFEKTFREMGYNCEICDITLLKFDGKRLHTPSGMEVHAIYRRAVTADIMENLDKVRDLTDAAKAGAVCLAGSFVTQIVHNKSFFVHLRNPIIQDYLFPEDREFIKKHIPLTRYLTADAAERIKNHRERWLLKPLDSYGASGVYLGKNMNYEDFERTVRELADKNYLYQRFVTPYKSPNLVLEDGALHKKDYYNLTGIYMYDGMVSGIYSRSNENELIGGKFGCRELVSLFEPE